MAKSSAVWLACIAASALVHWLVTAEVSRNLPATLTVYTESQDQPEPEQDISLIAAPEPEPELLDFEQPLELETPETLIPMVSAKVSEPVPSALSSGALNNLLPAQHAAFEALSSTAGDIAMPSGAAQSLGNNQESFAGYIQHLRSVGIDIMFVVDATGSMDWVINEVEQRVADIMDTIRGIVPLARFGIVAYRDFDDPDFVTTIQSLTFSRSKMNRFLAKLEAKGGGSHQEAVFAGMGQAMRNAGWRVPAQKVVIVIGDAPPYESNLAKILSLAKDLKQRGGRVSTLDVSADSNPKLIAMRVGRPVNVALYRNKPMLSFQAIADAGGGVAVTLEGEVEITRQLLQLIIGPQYAEEMKLLLEAV